MNTKFEKDEFILDMKLRKSRLDILYQLKKIPVPELTETEIKLIQEISIKYIK